MSEYSIGLDAYVHYDTTGVDTPTWVDLTIVEEVTLTIEHGEAEIKNRASAWVGVLLGLKDASVEVTITYDPSHAGFEAFRDAFLNKTLIGCAIMSDDIANSGAEGLVADMYVTSFARNEPLEEALNVTMTLRPAANSSNTPAWSETA